MTKSFFDMSEKPAKKPKKLNTCPCGLQETCEGPMMEPGGMGRRGIMVIAEAPGREEDAAYAREVKLAEQEGRGPLGTQLIGNAGKRLAKELMRYNIDLYEDCWLTNSCACRPPKNRTPTAQEIAACRPRVLKAIEELKPRFILVLGAAGLESLLAHRWYDGEGGLGGIGRWRGWQAPDQDLEAWVCPTFHPSYVLRCESGNDPQVPLYFSLDIERFAELVDHPKPWPKRPQEEQVEIHTERRAARLLTDLLEGSGAVTIDYETTGLKPNAPGHQIVCVGIGWGDDNAAAFQMTPRLEPLMAGFLRSKRGKIAQNLQFEERWSRVCLGTSVNGWCWDTMLAAHCLDNRGHISGLKFQSYVQLGITDYSSEISPFLKANSSLGMNRVLEAPREKLLRYCGMDALCTARIADIQGKQFEAGDAPWDGIQLLLEGAMILADDEENGVVVDRAYIRQQKTHFKKRIAAVLRRIEQSPEGQAWLEKYGDKLKFSSTQQLAWVLFDHMKLPIGKMTSGGKPSVDVGVLQELENKAPLVADVLEMRKLEKIAGTYLTGWEREIGSDGIMRPFYHLATARTFRSSSSSPNLQNVPIRDKIAQRACRRAVYPRAGHRLVEVDYSGIEVRVSACVHKDPQMIKYITDKTTDMHRDMAMECYKLELDEVSKAARQGAKNQFVFPEFYGSYWKNTGPGLWKWAQDCETAQGVSLIKHLKKHGLGTELRFMKHIRKVEDHFWNERFRVYNQWKEKFWKRYLRHGFFETLTGFRCQGPMRKNEVVNYPIQGCLQKGSRVWTSCGLIPIEKLVGISTNVWTGFNWANAVGVDMGSSQLAEIELSSGIIIHCDVRHKIKNENNKWVDFDDIQIGTKVALPKQPDVILPSDHITENFIYGFIIGDGCISNATRKSVEISVGQAKENDLIEIYKYMLQHMKLTRKYGGAHLYPKNQKGKIRLSVQNMEFAEKLEKLGFIFGSTAHTKSVPEYVWTAPIQHMRNFLEGLWCSDGAKLPWQQGNLHMCNLKLLREIQILSGILGYDSYISKTKTGFLLRFSARGFNKKAYRRYPMKHIHLCVSNISPDNYENKNQYVTDLRAFRKIKDPTQYIGERIIEKNARNAEVYRFDTVVNIRKLPVVENTYTMSVDDSLHQFVADGVITKNSAFHCLLKAKALTKQWIAEQRLEQDVLPCGQVHDSGMFSTAPDVFEHFAVNVHRIWCEELRKAWDWIIVPLEIEIDVTPVDGNWFQKEEYKIEVH